MIHLVAHYAGQRHVHARGRVFSRINQFSNEHIHIII